MNVGFAFNQKVNRIQKCYLHANAREALNMFMIFVYNNGFVKLLTNQTKKFQVEKPI